MPFKPPSANSSQVSSKKGTQSIQKPKGTANYTEDDMSKALEACSDENPNKISVSKAAQKFGIPPATLGGRRRGKKPRKDAHEHQQHLTQQEEEVLATFCRNRGWRGEPVSLAELRSLAGEICKGEVGENWVYSFLKRHPGLRRRWAKSGESKRASGLNQANVDSFFEELAKAREGVDPDCIWNCDEKGLQEGGGCVRARVVVGSDQRDPKVTADESRKMVTILECANAVGGVIEPLVIHEGAEKDGEWIRSNPCGAALAASPNGWTDVNVALEWLKVQFDPQTAKVAKGRKRLLILDGHNSHCGLDFILYAARKNITVLLLPPHTTHRLQPLDVNVFSHLAREWEKEVKERFKQGYLIRKANLISVYSIARKAALTENNIRTAFKQCGIEPYNPAMITEEMMAPAKRTTTAASQPIPPTLAPFMEVVTPPHEQPNPPPEPLAPLLDANLGPRDVEGQPLTRPNTMADITNHPPRRPLEGLKLRRTNRPGPPSEHATKSELCVLIGELFGLLDEDTKELAAGYAREMLANLENGRIREKIHGKSNGRAKTVPLKTGARILTAQDQINVLTEADRKKVLAKLGSEMRPLGRHRETFERALAKEVEGKRVQKEKADLEVAGKAVKGAEKERTSMEQKIKAARDLLTKATVRQSNATTPSTQRRAEESAQGHRSKIAKFNNDLLQLSAQYNDAKTRHEILLTKKQEHLDAIAAGNASYLAATAADNLKKQLDKQKADKDAARRARLPRIPKDMREIWKKRIEAMQRACQDSPEPQEDWFLPAISLRLQPLTFLHLPDGRHYLEQDTEETDQLSIELHETSINTNPVQELAEMFLGVDGRRGEQA